MDTALLALRVGLSLACVLGLIWFAGRKLQGTAGVRKQRTVPLSVLGRQSLGKGAGVALVEVAGRVLLLGVGEQGVRVLTEVDVPPAPAERTGEVREEIDLSTLVPAGIPVTALVPEGAALAGAPAAPAAPAAPVEDDTPDVAAEPRVTTTTDAPPAVAVVTDADADARTGAEAGDAPDARTKAEVAGSDAAAHHAGDVPQAHADGSARMAALAGLAAGKSASEAGALHGSVLSPDTWRRAVDVVQRRTARR